MARPTKLSPARTSRILAAIRDGCTREAAAAAGGVGARTFYEWCRVGRLHPDSPHGRFVDALELAELEAERELTADVRAAARSDWRAAIALLERRHPARWRRPPAAVEVAGRIEVDDQEKARRLAEQAAEYLARCEAEQTAAEPLEPSPGDLAAYRAQAVPHRRRRR